MDWKDFDYKSSKNPKILQQSNNQDNIQSVIFNQLQSTTDMNDLYMFLSYLSETITSKEKTINENFYSEWFISLIETFLNYPKSGATINPVLIEICIIIITKLIYVYTLKNITCFSDQHFITIYFNLLSEFNNKEKYNIAIESDDNPIVSLRIEIIRLISLISTDEALILFCIQHTEEIILYLKNTQNETLILFYSSFILNVLKFMNKTKSPIEFNLEIKVLINLIDSQNINIKQIGIEVFNQYLPYYGNIYEPQFLSDLIPSFIDFLDDDLYKIVSLALRVFGTIYSIKINFEDSKFHPIVLNKATELLLHRTPTVRYSAIICISSFISNFEGEIPSYDKLIQNLLLAGKKGSFDLQINITCVLANIINKLPSSLLINLPIQTILNFFVHIFESDCFDKISLLFRATFTLIDAVQTSQIDQKVLKPIFDFNFDLLSQEFPHQVESINLKKIELNKSEINEKNQ